MGRRLRSRAVCSVNSIELRRYTFVLPKKPRLVRIKGSGPTENKTPHSPPGTPRRKGRCHKNFSSNSDYDEYVGRVSLKAPHTQFSVIPSRDITDPRITRASHCFYFWGRLACTQAQRAFVTPANTAWRCCVVSPVAGLENT